jgi:tetratricopeptide (TPR) repeat protein
MKSRLEDDSRFGNLEGMIADKFLVDAFQPKICDEKDVVVVAFLVRQSNSAGELCDFIAQGPFQFLNVEASNTPDEDGNYVVLVEISRSGNMVEHLENLLEYIDQLAHIDEWYFQPHGQDSAIAWSSDSFHQWVPQSSDEFMDRKSGRIEQFNPQQVQPSSKREHTDSPHSAPVRSEPANIDYQALENTVAKQISRANHRYIKEFAKQHKKVITDNRRLLKNFDDLKSDYRFLYEQLAFFQEREKLGLLREKQDTKRIRDLENRFSFMLLAQSKSREIPYRSAQPSPIEIERIKEEAQPITETGEESEPESMASDSSKIQDNTTNDAGDHVADRQADNASNDAASVAPGSETTVSDSQPEAGTAAVSDTVVGGQQEGAIPEQPVHATPAAEADASKPPAKENSTSKNAAPREAAVSKKQEPAASESIETDLDEKNAVLEFDPVFDPVNEYLSMGIAASKRNEYHSAIECFKKVTVLAPKDQRSYYNLAVIYYRRKDYKKARHYAKQALALGADAAERIIKTIEAQNTVRKDELSAAQENTQTVLRLEDFIDVTPADETVAHRANEIEEAAEVGPEPEEAPGSSGNQLSTDTADIIEQPEATRTADESETAPVKEFAAFSEDIADTVEIHPGIVEMAEVEQIDQVQVPEAAPPHEEGQDSEKDNQTEQSRLNEAPVDAEQTQPTGPLDQGPEAEKRSTESYTRSNVETAEGQTIPEPDRVEAEDAAPEPEETIDYFALAMAASDRKDYAEAIAHFNKSLEQTPDKSRVYYNLAVLHYRLKDYSAALTCANRAVDMGAEAADRIVQKAERKLARSTEGPTAGVDDAQTETVIADGESTQLDMLGDGHQGQVPETEVQPPSQPEAEKPTKESMPTETMEITEADLIEILPEQESIADEDTEEITDISTLDGEPIESADPGETSRDIANFETEKGHSAKEVATGDDESATAAVENKLEPPPPAESTDAETLPQTQSRPNDPEETEAPTEAVATAAAGGDKQTVTAEDTPAEATPSPENVAEEPSKDYFALAMAASERKDYPEAIAHFTNFIEQAPDEPRGYYNLAVLHYRLKDYSTAIDCANRAVNLGAGAAQKIVEKAEKKLARSNENIPEAVASNLAVAAVAGTDTISFDMIGQDQIDSGAAIGTPPEPLPVKSTPAKPEDTSPKVDLPQSPPEADMVPEEDTDTIPEFPTLTGEIVEVTELKDGQGETENAAQEANYPEIEAVPLSDTGTEIEDENAFESSPPVEKIESEQPPDNDPGAAAPQDANSPAESTGPGDTGGETEPGAPSPQTPEEAFVAEASEEQAAKDYFALGQEAYARKDYGEAIELFNLFIERYPDEPRGYYNLAILHYRLKDYDAAEINAKSAYKLGAKAAKRVLQKVEKKRAAAAKPNASKLPPAASEPAQQPDTSGDKTKAAVPPETRVDPVDKQTPANNHLDEMSEHLNELPTTTINITEALGEDTIVWDADELEEAGTIENTAEEGDQGSDVQDDVILFDRSETEASAMESVFSFEESNQTDLMQEFITPPTPGTSAVEDDTAQEESLPAPGTEESEVEDDESCEYFALGLAASDQKEYLKAIQYFTKFTNLSPEDPRGFYNLAVVSYRLKFYETAHEHAKHALELGSEPAKRLIGKIEAKLAAT